ncbi:MAG TPA: hypothetical protein VIV27_05960 [Halioglobus sp.]
MRIRNHLSIFAMMWLVHPAYADISYNQHIKVDAAGGMSMLASEGDIVTLLSADKSRTDSAFAMKSPLVGMFAGSGKSGNIVRLDKSLMWNLLPDEQQYSELTFAQARAKMDEARQSMQQASAEGGSALPVTADGCQWTQGEVQVEHPTGTETIAGLTTRKHIIRMQQSCTDPSTKKTCDVTWLMETALAENVPGEQEARKFQQDYAQAMGMGEMMREVQGPAQSLLAMFASNWEDVADEFKKLRGYPLRTVMQMGIGGEQCTTASGQPIALDQVWTDASTAAYNAALNQAGSEAGSAVGQAAGETLGGSLAGSIGGAAVGAAAGELIGGLSGMFRKDTPAAAPEPQVNAGSSQVTVFRITTEVTSWSDAPISQERFNEPVGWQKL